MGKTKQNRITAKKTHTKRKNEDVMILLREKCRKDGKSKMQIPRGGVTRPQASLRVTPCPPAPNHTRTASFAGARWIRRFGHFSILSYQVCAFGKCYPPGIMHLNLFDAFIIYTFLLLYVHFSFDAAFIELHLIDQSTKIYNVCGADTQKEHFSLPPHLHNIPSKIQSFWQKNGSHTKR